MDINEMNELLAQLENAKSKVPYREINGIRIASGSKSRLVAICRKCEIEYKGEIIKDEGKAGVQKCDWCGCYNLFSLSESEQAKYLPNPEPIFQTKFDDAIGMALLKEAIGKDAIDKAFAESSSHDEAMNKIANNVGKAQEELDAYNTKPEDLI